MDDSRFDVFFENHIGFGIRWRKGFLFSYDFSISFMFLTINFKLGKKYN